MKNTTAKKFKYGSLSVVFTVVFIALVIGVNLIVSALDTSFNLRVDLTETELYSISPETDVARGWAITTRASRSPSSFWTSAT